MPGQYYISNHLKRFYYLISLKEPYAGDGNIRVVLDARNEEEAKELVFKKLTLEKKKFFKNI
tara:strand:+ start:2467 stop:2652 length:186 start_codon:yes stop_codon:yes gene_type:complete